jgi:hypothetical protein
MITKALFAIACVVSVSVAQIGVTVGPSPAPLQCPIAISIANDTLVPSGVPSPCPFAVRNAAGAYVFAPLCPAVVVPLAAGQVFTTHWNQVNDSNVQVPPGLYFVDVFYPGGMATIQVNIDATVSAAATTLGPVRIGTTRTVYGCAPADAGYPYLMGASGFPISGGISTCGGFVPLELDPLLLLSLGPNPFFLNFAGTLGSGGSTTAPAITVPFDPSLVGASFTVAFIAADSTAPCFVRRISAPLLVSVF